MPLDIAIYMHNKKTSKLYNNNYCNNDYHNILKNDKSIDNEKNKSYIYRILLQIHFDIYKDRYTHIFI